MNNHLQTNYIATTEVPSAPPQSMDKKSLDCLIAKIEIVAIVTIVIVGIWGYFKSVKSRKYYKCPNCGEKFRTENMTAKTCSVCGAEVQGTEE